MLKGIRVLVGGALALAAGASLVARPAQASLVLALDLPSMVARADHVAVVDVVSVTSAWDERHEKIISTIELDVVESWKSPSGAPAPTHLKVVQLGGVVDDISMTVHGMSHFVPGERALVFLRGSRADRLAVVGMAQGKRAVRHDATTGRWVVHAPDKAGALFVPQTPASSTAPVFDSRLRPIDDLRAEVRALAASHAPPSGSR